MRRGGWIILGLLAIWMAALSPVPLQAASTEELEREVKALMEQNRALARRLAEVERELARLKAGAGGSAKATASQGAREAEPVAEGAAGGEKAAIPEWIEKVHLGGLLEFGAAYRDTYTKDQGHVDESDLSMTTLELDVDMEATSWLRAQGVLLYEDTPFEDAETSLDVDMATITLGDSRRSPWGLTVGKMYLPFGSLETKFPDDPFIDLPLSLKLGEISEKAVLVSYDAGGLSLSAYAFNGDVDERGRDNHISDYGFDFHFERGFDFSHLRFYKRGSKYEHALDPRRCVNFMVGSSFLSDLGDSDTLQDVLGGREDDPVPGWALYGHLHHCNLFLSFEYMAALASFSSHELPAGSGGATPAVWNVETGFTYAWWRPLDVVFKWAGSRQTQGLGLPRSRYGIDLNQELWDGVTLSVGYLYDQYQRHDGEGRNHRNLLFSQLAVGF